MQALRPGEREVLRLVLWDGASHAEAAALFGCTANAAELRYRRARNRFREAFLAGRRRAELRCRKFHLPSPLGCRAGRNHEEVPCRGL
jgi:predicted DNA-binding protein (UPF0251 family)